MTSHLRLPADVPCLDGTLFVDDEARIANTEEVPG